MSFLFRANLFCLLFLDLPAASTKTPIPSGRQPTTGRACPRPTRKQLRLSKQVCAADHSGLSDALPVDSRISSFSNHSASKQLQASNHNRIPLREFGLKVFRCSSNNHAHGFEHTSCVKTNLRERAERLYVCSTLRSAWAGQESPCT